MADTSATTTTAPVSPPPSSRYVSVPDVPGMGAAVRSDAVIGLSRSPALRGAPSLELPGAIAAA
ncbi:MULTISPECIES: hypothetical protein [unclassified Modestobacter]